MKFLLAVFLLFSVFTSVAQDYSCFRPDRKNYFINGNSYVRGIRIDSFRVAGTDTVFYPYRTSRISNYLPGGATVDTLGGSWLGRNVVKQQDGTFVFDNIWDTVFIKAHAHTGDSWIFFNDTTDISYVATVTAEDTMTVAGTLDSVKTITITADSGGLVNAFDPVNNFQIIVSKNNGFVQVFDLCTFPYHYPHFVGRGRYYGGTHEIRNFDYYLDVVLGNLGTCDLGCTDNLPDTVNSVFHLFPFHNPQLREIYDYSVGDVYESYFTSYNTSGPGFAYEKYTLDTVTSKTTSPFSVSYGGSEYTMVTTFETSSPGIKTVTRTSSPFIASGDTSLLIYGMPEEWNRGFLLYYFLSDNRFAACESRPSYKVEDDFRGSGFGYTGIAYLPSERYRIYTPGLGISASYDFNATSMVTQQQSYSFYHKDTVSCGAFVNAITAGIAGIKTDNVITISPIPASDHFEIRTDKPLTSGSIISVFDISGKRVLQLSADFQSLIRISTSAWPTGVYLVIIQDSSGFVKKEKIVVER